MAVDDTRVTKIIQDALDSAKGSTTFDRVDNAWQTIEAARQDKENCDNEELAAASHYFTARWWVNKLGLMGAFAARISVLVYDVGLKGLASVFHLEDRIPRTGLCPASPFSTDVVRWGLLGIAMGEDDISWPSSSGRLDVVPKKHPPVMRRWK
jgi:hypothetical protein